MLFRQTEALCFRVRLLWSATASTAYHVTAISQLFLSSCCGLRVVLVTERWREQRRPWFSWSLVYRRVSLIHLSCSVAFHYKFAYFFSFDHYSRYLRYTFLLDKSAENLGTGCSRSKSQLPDRKPVIASVVQAQTIPIYAILQKIRQWHAKQWKFRIGILVAVPLNLYCKVI